MSRFRLSISALIPLLVAALLAVVPATAGAADPVMCNDYEATIVGDGTVTPIEGTSGADVIVGSAGKDVINGNGGDDIICGGGGGDTIDGGTGNDKIWGQGGHDKIKGGKGDDTIRSGKGNDKIWGNGGANDIAWAGSGSDTCIAEREGNCELDTRWGHTPDDWLPLLDEYFGDIGETANARIILGCESTGEPFILGPDGAHGRPMGLFQFLPSTWDRRNPTTPEWAGESPFHPEANIATARKLYDDYVAEDQWGWSAWSCRRLLEP